MLPLCCTPSLEGDTLLADICLKTVTIMEKVFYTNKVTRKDPTKNFVEGYWHRMECISQCIFVMVMLCVNEE